MDRVLPIESRTYGCSIGGAAESAVTVSASSISSAQLVLALDVRCAGAFSGGGGARPDEVNARQLDANIESLQDVSRWLARSKAM